MKRKSYRAVKAKRAKAKNTILIGLAYLSVIVMFVSVCCLDSESWIPSIAFILSCAYMFLFALANGGVGDEYS